MMTCKICGSSSQKVFEAKILHKYEVSYFKCRDCGFLQTEEPYWFAEAVQEAINLSDTGILSRSIFLSQQTATILYFLFNRHARFVDYAGGYGILTRLMRDLGFDFYWDDLFAKNIFAEGFEYSSKLGEIALITSFESFEHFIHPLAEIEKMLKISPNILFSTELLPTPLPGPKDWWYYGLDHGQHLSFYSFNTLAYMAQKYHLNFYSNGSNIHLFTPKTLNNTLFKLLLKSSKYGLFCLVKRKMKGRSSADIARVGSTLHNRKDLDAP